MALELVPAEQDDEVDEQGARRMAWAIIAAAFKEALAVDGLSIEDRATFAQMSRQAKTIAGAQALSILQGGDA